MPRRIAFACFFLSGFAGLVYEIAWIRRAALVFGSTTAGLSTVLAVFFGGLALGSWLIGRLALRTGRPLRWYALAEFGVALGALATPWLFHAVDGVFGALWRSSLAAAPGPSDLTWLQASPGLAPARVALVALVLLVPTTLMGGTLPLFVRQFAARRDALGASVGFLYGLNTLGAMVGALAAGFVLLPVVGVTGAIAVGAALNVVAGLLSLRIPLAAPAPEPPAAAGADPVAAPALRRALPALFAAAGLVGVGAEVVWSRFLALVVRNSVTTYTLTLATVLAGIVAGSWLAARLADRSRVLGLDRGAWYGVLQLLAAGVPAALMALPAAWWHGLGAGLGPIALMMLPGAIASGALFPLAGRLAVTDASTSAAGIGRMAALNTVGGIAGSLLVGFAVLPHLGLAAAVRLLAVVGVAAGLVALFTSAHRLVATLVGAAAAALAFGTPLLTGTVLPDDHLVPPGQLVGVAEGSGATLAAIRLDDRMQLQIDHLWQGNDRKGHQVMAAHVPALLHGAPRDVLVIGVGVGQTAGRFLMHGVERLDCVDIEPAIFPFVDRHFPGAWMHDPRVTVVPEDGRTFTAHTDRRYDLVSVEVGQVFRPGVDAFYTREFYREARALLKPGGLAAQFVSLAFLDDASFRSVLATFLAEFPHAVLWYNTQELLLIGSPEAAPRLDLARLDPAALGAELTADLAWSAWGGVEARLDRPGAFLGGFLCGGRALASLAADGRIYDDDRPALAYATADAQAWQHREAPLAARIGHALSPLADVLADTTGVAADVLDLAARTRTGNVRDLVAAGYVEDAVSGVVTGTGRPATAAQVMGQLEQALQANPLSYHGWYNLGKARLLARQPEAAITPLQRAADLRPDDGLARRDLGLALLQANRPAAARPELEAAVALRPDDAAAFNYLGAALGAEGDLSGAARAFERSLAIDPTDASVRQNLERARRPSGAAR
ncbi:MAG TPA: fused MFS/spermidine synthase [Candidatus Krumholzibacteria bacterium]|nr:fused MFS/spermidine synthase [Candidatus Krumholzibacteria bacterium]